MRRFFYDTEFIEDGTTIDLVSIGVVDEAGREFYAVSTEFDPAKAIPWVRRNVLDQLPPPADKAWRSRERIREELLSFLTGPGEEIELWAWFGAYDHVALCQPVAAVVAGARRTERPSMVARWTGYFRESAGPGWALVGDAGHFKDPSPGQGITDALRQAQRLADDVVEGLSGSRPLDQAMRDWWRWRDLDAREMAWFAGDLGRGGRVPPVLVELLRHFEADPTMVDRWIDVLNHRVRPSDILTPPRLLGATARLLRGGDQPAAELLRDTREIVARDLRRRWLDRRHRYGDPPEN